MKIVKKHIENIRAGDLVQCEDGFIRTVCVKDLRRDPFVGITLWGDCYALGLKLVDVVVDYDNSKQPV